MQFWEVYFTSPGKPPFGIREQMVIANGDTFLEALENALQSSNFTSEEIVGITAHKVPR